MLIFDYLLAAAIIWFPTAHFMDTTPNDDDNPISTPAAATLLALIWPVWIPLWAICRHDLKHRDKP